MPNGTTAPGKTKPGGIVPASGSASAAGSLALAGAAARRVTTAPTARSELRNYRLIAWRRAVRRETRLRDFFLVFFLALAFAVAGASGATAPGALAAIHERSVVSPMRP